jgi:hypothetical protein
MAVGRPRVRDDEKCPNKNSEEEVEEGEGEGEEEEKEEEEEEEEVEEEEEMGWRWLYRPRRTAGLYPLPHRAVVALHPLTPFCPYNCPLSPSRRYTRERTCMLCVCVSARARVYVRSLPRVVVSSYTPQSVSNPPASDKRLPPKSRQATGNVRPLFTWRSRDERASIGMTAAARGSLNNAECDNVEETRRRRSNANANAIFLTGKRREETTRRAARRPGEGGGGSR